MNLKEFRELINNLDLPDDTEVLVYGYENGFDTITGHEIIDAVRDNWDDGTGKKKVPWDGDWYESRGTEYDIGKPQKVLVISR